MAKRPRTLVAQRSTVRSSKSRDLRGRLIILRPKPYPTEAFYQVFHRGSQESDQAQPSEIMSWTFTLAEIDRTPDTNKEELEPLSISTDECSPRLKFPAVEICTKCQAMLEHMDSQPAGAHSLTLPNYVNRSGPLSMAVSAEMSMLRQPKWDRRPLLRIEIFSFLGSRTGR